MSKLHHLKAYICVQAIPFVNLSLCPISITCQTQCCFSQICSHFCEGGVTNSPTLEDLVVMVQWNLKLIHFEQSLTHTLHQRYALAPGNFPLCKTSIMTALCSNSGYESEGWEAIILFLPSTRSLKFHSQSWSFSHSMFRSEGTWTYLFSVLSQWFWLKWNSGFV